MGETISIKDGRQVEVRWDDDDEKVRVWTVEEPASEIGGFNYRYLDDEGSGREYILVTWMDLDGPNNGKTYLEQGVGSHIVRKLKEIGPVIFRRHDGQVRDDGSHLTGMAPGFAQKMVAAGLAYWDSDE